MLTEVKVPPMGESIAGGILAAWHVKDGELVRQGQHLFDLETDKITSEGQAPEAGRISLKSAAGDEVKIGQVIALIDTSVAVDAAAPAPAAAPAATAPEGSKPALPLSPAARRVAEETGVDPAKVKGTGKDGRVTKGDLLAAASAPAPEPASAAKAAPAPVPAAAPSAAAPKPAGERSSRRKLTPIRKRIAERLVQAKSETAMLTTFNEVDMSAVKGLRERFQDDFTKRHGVKLGFMSLFIKAAVHALKEVPAVANMIDGEDLIENRFFDVGVAVSTERGLMVPVLRDCDTKSLAQLEKDLGSYAAKARDGKITLEDLQGGVFTITNGGIFGSMLSTPILNPPQSAILGMHSITERPVAINGQVVIRPMMYLALSYDHRIIDGREAVTFLVKVKQAIEDPVRLLLAV